MDSRKYWMVTKASAMAETFDKALLSTGVLKAWISVASDPGADEQKVVENLSSTT